MLIYQRLHWLSYLFKTVNGTTLDPSRTNASFEEALSLRLFEGTANLVREILSTYL